MRSVKILGALLAGAMCVAAQAAPFAYIGSSNGQIYVLDVASNTVVSIVPALASAQTIGLASSPDGTRVFAGTGPANALQIVNTATNLASSLANIPGSTAVAFDPSGNPAYIASENGASPGSVTILNTVTMATSATVPVGKFPLGIAVSPDGNRVYVANGMDATVSVIDTKAGDVNFQQVIATINAGGQSFGLAVSPDGSKVYVPSVSNNSLSVIAVSSSGTPSPTPTAIALGQASAAVAFDPAGRCAYVSEPNASAVAVVNVATGAVAGTIPVAGSPSGIALTHDGRYAYVANQQNGTVSAIDAATARVVATVTLNPSQTEQAISIGKFITPQNTDSIFANDFGVCGF